MEILQTAELKRALDKFDRLGTTPELKAITSDIYFYASNLSAMSGKTVLSFTDKRDLDGFLILASIGAQVYGEWLLARAWYLPSQPPVEQSRAEIARYDWTPDGMKRFNPLT